MQRKNLPTITARYWTAILAASMCGANTGDFLSRNLHLGHTRGLLPLAALFFAILWAERHAKTATEAYYWLAIIVLRTGATNLADFGTHDLKVGYGLIEPGLTALLIVILLVDRARGQSTASGAQPIRGRWQSLPATDATYWAAMLTAGTLGTATGDFVAGNRGATLTAGTLGTATGDFAAGTLGLGVGFGSIVLAAIFAIVLLISVRVGGMSKPWYWASIVAARTAGTTMGDFVASQHGLNLGLTVSTACTGCLLASIVVLWRDKSAIALREA
jgi:uncharacterized membrane-anchored protein